MKKIIWLIIPLLVVNTALADIVINQVLYDPISETTGEAVEMYNNGNAVDISNWMLKTGASEHDAVIPANTILYSGYYYLIADNGWNNSKQANWRQADLEETINLYNTNSGIALLDYDFNIIDAVGWGAVNNTELYRGAPANPVSEGRVLKRINTTDNNLNDFTEAEADFSGTTAGSEIILEVIVVSPLSFEILISPDDSELAGYQVMPNPGDYKPIIVRANTSENLSLSAVFLAENKQMQLVDGVYQTDFGIPFSLKPGLYNITITSNNFAKVQEFEYLGLTALEIDTNRVVFDNAVPGREIIVLGDQKMETTDKATIHNIGNVILDIDVYGTDLVSDTGKIDVKNVMFSFDNAFDYMLSERLDYSSILFDLDLNPALKKEMGFKLNVPVNATGGRYTGKVNVVGVGNG